MDAAESLIKFTEYSFPRYRTAPHHRIIAEQLERVERGEIDRLMLLVPPRHGKSELASIRLPAWYLGRQPHKQFLSVSATDGLASDFGRSVRNTINSPEYKAIFDTTLAEDSQAKGKWHTSDGGIYYALGIGGSVLGRGGDVVLIDDPFGSMQDAQSELERKNVWDWYTGTAYNRLMPGGAIVVINHRMHEDDLCGRLLAQQAAGGDTWEVVELPAINETGEALWPEAYPIEALDRIRLNSQARFWSALYMQKPAPDDGDYFRSEWLKPYDRAPARTTLRIYGGSDYAVTENGGDFTVHAIVGLDPEGRMYLLDIWRKQAASDEWVEAFCDLVKEWKPIGWAEEQGQIRAGIGPYLDRRQRERQAFCARRAFPTRGDKAVRAQSIRGRMALEGLYVPVNAPWYPALRSELLSFPAGKHDDQCLAEDTLITMADGSCRRLDGISVGDLVATPLGPCPVIASAVTNEAAKVYRVSFSDGRSLTATDNHPVLVADRGFLQVSELRVGDQAAVDILEMRCGQGRVRRRSLNIAATVIVDILTGKTSLISAISMARSHVAASCTGISGKMNEGLSLPAMKFITSTKIRSIIASTILNVCRPKNTERGILWVAKPWTGRLSTWGGSGRSRQPGTAAMKGSLGIAPMAALAGKAVQQLSAYVSAVVWPLMRVLSAPNFALVPVSNDLTLAGLVHDAGDDSARRASPSNAFAATGRLSPSGRTTQSIVPKPAVCVTAIEALSQPMRVRNLTVARAHTFFANGILTHNCDALGLVGQLLDIMVKGTAPIESLPMRGADEMTMDEAWKLARPKTGTGGRI